MLAFLMVLPLVAAHSDSQLLRSEVRAETSPPAWPDCTQCKDQADGCGELTPYKDNRLQECVAFCTGDEVPQIEDPSNAAEASSQPSGNIDGDDEAMFQGFFAEDDAKGASDRAVDGMSGAAAGEDIWQSLVLDAAGMCSERTMYAAEIFSGAHTWTDEWRLTGMDTLTYDIIDSSALQDITTVKGVTTLINQASLVMEKGVVHLAPKCSTFVWVNRSTSGRTKTNPEGDLSKPQVREANNIAQIVSRLIRFLHDRGVYYVIEQPMNSLFFHLQDIEDALTSTEAVRICFSMGDLFGAKTKKQTECWGTAPWLSSLVTVPKLLRDCSVRLATTKDGRVTGNSQLLKESQEYPPSYGRRMAELHHMFLASFTMLGLWSIAPLAFLSRIVSFVHGPSAACKAMTRVWAARGMCHTAVLHRLEDLMKMHVPQLQQILDGYGKSRKGRKLDLVNRILHTQNEKAAVNKHADLQGLVSPTLAAAIETPEAEPPCSGRVPLPPEQLQEFPEVNVKACTSCPPPHDASLKYADHESHMCVASCPPGKAPNDKMACAVCKPPFSYADHVNKKCVAKCPPGKVPDTLAGNDCKECEAPFPYADHERHACVKQCGPGKVGSTDLKECRTCEAGKYADHKTHTCVAVCPLDHPYMDGLDCVMTCSEGKVPDPSGNGVGNICSYCPEGKFADHAKHQCVTHCGPGYTPDPDGTLDRMYMNDCKRCPMGKFANHIDNRCDVDCPNGTKQNVAKRNCDGSAPAPCPPVYIPKPVPVPVLVTPRPTPRPVSAA